MEIKLHLPDQNMISQNHKRRQAHDIQSAVLET